MKPQVSQLDYRGIVRRVRLKFSCGGGFTCNDRINTGSKLDGHNLASQGERSSVGGPFGEDDGIFGIRAKAVLARLEPEKPGQWQPVLFEIFDQIAFPFLE